MKVVNTLCFKFVSYEVKRKYFEKGEHIYDHEKAKFCFCKTKVTYTWGLRSEILRINKKSGISPLFLFAFQLFEHLREQSDM